MIRTLTLLFGVVAAVALFAQTAQAAPIASTGYSPVGTWRGVVTSGDEPPHEATFQFAASGKVCLTFGEPGDASGSGTGTWKKSGYNRFTFELTHDVILPDGTLAAYVTVHHSAVQQSRNGFTSSGTTDVTNPDGSPQRSGPSSVEATRTGATAPTCA